MESKNIKYEYAEPGRELEDYKGYSDHLENEIRFNNAGPAELHNIRRPIQNEANFLYHNRQNYHAIHIGMENNSLFIFHLI
jgi:hypothetical protein